MNNPFVLRIIAGLLFASLLVKLAQRIAYYGYIQYEEALRWKEGN